MAETKRKFEFAIDRGGTFTDVFARLPDGRERVLKLLSRDPQNYKDAPTEGIRRVLEEVTRKSFVEMELRWKWINTATGTFLHTLEPQAGFWSEKLF